MPPCSSTDTCKIPVLSNQRDQILTNNLSTAVQAFFHIHTMTLLSVDKILLPRYMNRHTNFRGLLLKVEMASSYSKHMSFVLSAFT